MAHRMLCSWCGYPVSVEERMTVEGGELVFYDGKTGEVIEQCPGCGDWLEIPRLFPDSELEPASGRAEGGGR